MTAEPRLYAPSTDRPPRLDVGARLDDVRRMTLHHEHLVARCLAAGWAEEDLLQEVATRIAARQTPTTEADGTVRLPKSAYDPVRAGVGKYLFTSTRTILSNLADCRRYTGSTSEQLSDDGFVEGVTEPPDLDAADHPEEPMAQPTPPSPTDARPPRRRTVTPAPGEVVSFVAPVEEPEAPTLELNVTGLAVRFGDRSVELAGLRLSAPPAAVLQLVNGLVARAAGV